MNSQELFRLSSRVILGGALTLWYLTTSTGLSADSWTRGIGGGTLGAADIKTEAFSLNSVSKDGGTGHMWGSCVYYNRTPVAFALEGTETSDGDFCPSVVNQVGNDENGEWKIVARPVVHGEAGTLTVPAKSKSKLLTVDLDAFVPMIGQFKYGRLLLKNGEFAIFDLDYLRTPKSEK